MFARLVLVISLLGQRGSSREAEEGCLRSCRCEQKREGASQYMYVRCRGRNITDVPQYIPASTTHLVLENTAIVSLTNKSKEYYSRYSNMTKLSFRNNPELLRIGSDAFSGIENLKFLYLSGNDRLMDIEDSAFRGLKKLMVLSITKSYNLKQIKAGVLNVFPALDTLKIAKCALEDVPNLFEFRPTLHTGITDILLHNINSDVSRYQRTYIALHVLWDFSFNNIKTVHANAFSFHMDPSAPVYTLHLNDNPLELVKNYAFNDSKIVRVKLNNTPLKKIEPQAFKNAQSLGILYLDNTLITELPTDGLHNVTQLYLQNVPTLEVFPSVLKLSKIQTAKLTYPSHCCAFNNPEKQSPQEYRRFQEKVKQECSSEHSPTMPNKAVTEYDDNGFMWPQQNRRRRRRGQGYVSSSRSDSKYYLYYHANRHFGFSGIDMNKTRDSQIKTRDFSAENHFRVQKTGKGKRQVDTDDDFHDDFPAGNEQWYHKEIDINENATKVYKCGNVLDIFKSLNCTPQPNALNPCEGVMGYDWLRVVVWFVVTMAVLGNMIVIVVSLCSRHKMTVSKFLMCNLAFSDLTLGLYLLILASIDVHTLGEYFNHAIGWQFRGGCQAAGFIAVFSQSLSIFTLTIITLERWYAISHAIHLTKRLRLRQAYCILGCGWGFALIAAMLPILSISSYSEVSICLPMRARNFIDKVYLFFLLVFNTSAFVVILVSYLDMFRKVRVNATTARSNDATIAKRMSILVFTDFACLFPVCFFGITAAAGAPLISITESKILLVLFYPLNSCANPFLYAIFTKQFKKDLFGLLNRLGFCQKQVMKNRVALYSSNPHSLSHSRNHCLPMSALHKFTLRSSDRSALTQSTSDHTGRRPLQHNTGHVAHVEVIHYDKKPAEMPLTMSCADCRSPACASIPQTKLLREMDYQKYKMFHEREKSPRCRDASNTKHCHKENSEKNQSIKHQFIPEISKSPSRKLHGSENYAKPSLIRTSSFDSDIHELSISDESANDAEENDNRAASNGKNAIKQTKSLSEGKQRNPDKLRKCEMNSFNNDRINLTPSCTNNQPPPSVDIDRNAENVCNEKDLANENHTLLVK